MTFISTISETEAEGAVKALYDEVRASFGYVPNMAKAFSHRPEVWKAWEALLESICIHMEPRRYELVTLAAAQELRSSYCMLAHGSILARDFFETEEVRAIVDEPVSAPLNVTDKAIMQFARKVVRDASLVTASDISGLKALGLTEAEIFDVASAAAVRCFFSKTLDALGTRPDAAYGELDDGFKQVLTVGRPIEA